MLVDSSKMKRLRLDKNWTQQHLADVCDLSMRTIQRVEKDGVASNETVSSYAAVFELLPSDILLSVKDYEKTDRSIAISPKGSFIFGVFFIGGFAAGVGITLWFF